MPRPLFRQPCDQHGSVLILALWTLFFLAALAVAIGSQVSAGIRQATVLRDDLEGYATARAGVATALAVLVGDTNGWDAANDEWGSAGVLGQPVTVAQGVVEVTHMALTSDGTVVTNRGVIDEEGLISINAAGQQLLSALFRIRGGLDDRQAGALADAVLDWRDADDDELTGGAENDYYSNLGDGYRVHNGSFQAIEELVLVRGFTSELLERLRPMLTLHGSGKLNLNTAGPVALLCLADRWGADPDVSKDLVEKILGFREGGGVFESGRSADVVAALGEYAKLTAEENGVLKMMTRSAQVGSRYFRGTVTSSVTASGAGRWRMDFVFDRERQEKVYWYER